MLEFSLWLLKTRFSTTTGETPTSQSLSSLQMELKEFSPAYFTQRSSSLRTVAFLRHQIVWLVCLSAKNLQLFQRKTRKSNMFHLSRAEQHDKIVKFLKTISMHLIKPEAKKRLYFPECDMLYSFKTIWFCFKTKMLCRFNVDFVWFKLRKTF